MHEYPDDRPNLHAICVWCFEHKQATARLPLRLPLRQEQREEVCCWCGRRTVAGIYLREDPSDVPCHGAPHAGDQRP